MYYYKDGLTIRISSSNNKGGDTYKCIGVKTNIVHCDKVEAVPLYYYKNNYRETLENLSITRNSEELVDGDLCIIASVKASGVFIFKGVYGNAVILKRFKPGRLELAELSDGDCEVLNIKWSKGLYLVNSMIALKKFKEFEYYNQERLLNNNLSKYPDKDKKGLIHYMILKLPGFSLTEEEGLIRSPKGGLIDSELFLVSLKVSLNKDLISITGQSTERKAGEDLSWEIISDKVSYTGSDHSEDILDGRVCSKAGNVYIIVSLSKDGIGVSPFSLENEGPNDIFSISWDEAFSKDFKAVKEWTRNSMINYQDNLFSEIKKDTVYFRKIKKGKQIIPEEVV